MSFDEKKLYTLLSPYKLKRFIKKTEITVGRFSSVELFKDDMYELSFFKNKIQLGSFVQCADGVKFITAEHNNTQAMNLVMNPVNLEFKQKIDESKALCSKGEIIIGNNVVLSNNVTVLSGVSIGDGAVVGSDAVVTKDVPAFSIVAGNPARVIKYRFNKDTIAKLLILRWWDLEYSFLKKHIRTLYHSDIDKFILFLEKNTPLRYYKYEDNYIEIEANRKEQQFSVKNIYKDNITLPLDPTKLQKYFGKIIDEIPLADEDFLYN